MNSSIHSFFNNIIIKSFFINQVIFQQYNILQYIFADHCCLEKIKKVATNHILASRTSVQKSNPYSFSTSSLSMSRYQPLSIDAQPTTATTPLLSNHTITSINNNSVSSNVNSTRRSSPFYCANILTECLIALIRSCSLLSRQQFVGYLSGALVKLSHNIPNWLVNGF